MQQDYQQQGSQLQPSSQPQPGSQPQPQPGSQAGPQSWPPQPPGPQPQPPPQSWPPSTGSQPPPQSWPPQSPGPHLPPQSWSPQPGPQSSQPSLSRAGLKRTINKVCLVYGGFMVAIIVFSALVAFTAVLIAAPAISFEQSIRDGATPFDALANSPDFERITSDAISSSATLAQLLAVLLGTLLFFILRGKRLLTSDLTTRQQSPRATTLLALFGLALGVQFLMMIINAAFTPVLEQADLSLTEAMEEGISSFMLDPIGLLYVVLLGPLCEEIVFRGAILRALEPYGANFAIVASSILFGLYHIILYQAVFAFLLGLVLAYTAGRFSLKWALLLHVANNALAMSEMLFSPLVGVELYSLVLVALFFAGFVFSIIYLIFKRRTLVAQKVAGAPLVAHPFRLFFTRPVFLIELIVILALGLATLGMLG